MNDRLSPMRSRVPTLVAWVLRLVAVLSLIELLHRAGRANASRLQDAALDGVAVTVVIMLTSVTLVFARALSRRKRRAWRFALALMVVMAVLFWHRQVWSGVALNLAMMGLLIWTRAEFRAQSEPSSRWVALRAGVITLAVTFGASFSLVQRAAPHATNRRHLWETVRGIVGLYPNLPFRSPAMTEFATVALPGLGLTTLAVVLFIWLAPRRKPAVLGAADEARLRDLLARHGSRDSLGYFAARRDKNVIFSASGKAAITYRVIGGVSLASADPIGDREAWPGAIGAWLDEAESYAWTPGVLGASHDGATAYVKAGLDALEIGDEAVLDLANFSLAGRDMRAVRQAVARVARAGYTVTINRQGELDPAELAQVLAAAQALRDSDVERGFSMALGRLGDPADPQVVIVQARDEQGKIVAVISLVPWGSDGLSLDIMRRSRASENGTLEFLVAALAEQSEALGVRRLSLNFAVFRSALERGSQIGAGPVLRIWRAFLVWASRWWQIESLYRANAKYHPEWVARMICFPRATDLPRVALAALQAEAFIVRPRLARLLRPRR